MIFLTEEEKMLQAALQDFAEHEVKPQAAHIDDTEEFPQGILDKMGALGWMGIVIPGEYGGAGGNTMHYVLAMEEIARASAAVALIMGAHNSLACWTLHKYGNEEQRKRLLPAMASGKALGAYSLTEPNSGSDAASLETRAVRDGDDYVLNGRKSFVTNGGIAETVIVFTSTDRAQRARGITAFILEKGMPGFTAGTPLKKMGMRGSTTAELVLEDVRVPASNRLGEEGQGFRIAMQVLDVGRIGIAGQALGIAQAALDAAVAYAVQREQFGKPIAEFQGVAWMLAEMSVRVDAARALTYKAVRLREAGEPFGMASATAKYFASETATFCADKAIQVHGGYGYIKDFGVERLLRDAKITEIYEGTSEIQRLVISRELIKNATGG